uniref:C-type lectin domain-containing protein n=1 Tax=Macrostomum lignano TaxID=282301 RepID=A0A1I8GE24_9PLAT
MQFLSVSVPLLLLLLGAASAASKNRCDSLGSNSEGWILHSGSCYRWTESPDYWYTAEQACKAEDGHLVSIGSQTENTLVGRLTYCRTAWLGRYGTHADRLNDSASYRWTDGSSAVAFQRHDFAKLYSPHQPLVTAENLVWLNNLYHDRQGYVCKAPVARQAKTDSNPPPPGPACPSGWYSFGDYCYQQPGFKATYIEADFFCAGRQAHVVSVHTESELRLLSLLDLSEPICSVELWLGLVKLNPCRVDYFNGRKQQICYHWADRSGDHRGFPVWAAGHPKTDLVTNCVLLRDRNLLSAPCHLRRNFICKRPRSGLPPTQPPTQPP